MLKCLADAFGCAAIGIQYQQGLKDLCVASDLTEGLLNNPERPPVRHGGRRGNGRASSNGTKKIARKPVSSSWISHP